MWRRALAFVVDLIPIGIIVWIENDLQIADDPLVGFWNFMFLLVYFMGMNYLFGGTIGKRLLGLRVALPQGPRSEIIVRLFLRAFLKIVCLFPLHAICYGIIAIWRKDGRSIADFAGRTTVVEADTLAPPHQQSVAGRVSSTVLLVIAPAVVFVVIMAMVFGYFLIETGGDLIPAAESIPEFSGGFQKMGGYQLNLKLKVASVKPKVKIPGRQCQCRQYHRCCRL